MRGIVVINGNAGSSDRMAGIEQKLTDAGFTIHPTSGPGDGRRAAMDATNEGFDLVVAAGGDGTVSEVVEGLMAAGNRARLGVLPLGTGNDFARTLAIPLDAEAALAALLAERERVVDLIRVEVDDAVPVHAVNMAAGGFSGRVGGVMSAETKARWGPLAYVFGAAEVLPELHGYRTTLAWDDGGEEQIDALNIIVANGRYCAGGKLVAPFANPEDGLFDVVVVRTASLLDLAGVAARLALGNYLESDVVLFRRARSLRVRSEPNMSFNADGDLLPEGAVTFRLLPGVLRVLVGADYSPVSPEAEPPKVAVEPGAQVAEVEPEK